MFAMKIFAGKKALLVGGSGGIGAALSVLLAENGAEVIVHAGHQSEKCDALMKRIRALSPASSSFVQPLSAKDFSRLEETPLLAHAEVCDILCVCYGPFVQKSLEETTAEDWQMLSLMDYALPGLLVSKALPRMQEKKWGRILLFGGTGTERRTIFRTNAAYGGAKAGLNVVVHTVSALYGKAGITCNAVLPAPTFTEYTREAEVLAEKLPGGSLLSPEEVASAGLFLLQNDRLNGVLLPVDRGWNPSFS